VVRLFPSLGGYLYAQQGQKLFVNLFVASHATTQIDGHTVRIAQETRYPWEGTVQIRVDPAAAARFTLCLRIPGWAQEEPLPGLLYRFSPSEPTQPVLTVNGRPEPIQLQNGYARLERLWQPGDVVELLLPLPVRCVETHEAVVENRGSVAVTRGPLVYCLEGIDNQGRACGRSLAADAVFDSSWRPDLLHGVVAVHARSGLEELTFVPYYAWGHRGTGEMAVWLQR
jgi:DUF1680 family protein